MIYASEAYSSVENSLTIGIINIVFLGVSTSNKVHASIYLRLE